MVVAFVARVFGHAATEGDGAGARATNEPARRKRPYPSRGPDTRCGTHPKSEILTTMFSLTRQLRQARSPCTNFCECRYASPLLTSAAMLVSPLTCISWCARKKLCRSPFSWRWQEERWVLVEGRDTRRLEASETRDGERGRGGGAYHEFGNHTQRRVLETHAQKTEHLKPDAGVR